ncbi:hypothetical protein RchiOBHm_Chr7g0208151 [Rosa chinensis]|uniref:Uncharacterized protein n=1 Tax=Rosa chinensis TaxID=74649 RepID=A0A2P6P9M9_ROSCH|nr:hypothetical protein RchiOBHm_Chr7g0208151 [Rosa chinensis]
MVRKNQSLYGKVISEILKLLLDVNSYKFEKLLWAVNFLFSSFLSFPLSLLHHFL